MAEGPFRLDGKTALVTGGGQGIGKAICMALAEAGASVAVTDLPANQDSASQVVAAITSGGAKARAYALDVTQTSQIKDVVEQAAAELGGLDILVNNAGV
ncbi:MAG: SDR family NAD(P)-dependent oxidoreductase, partial [Dehalococcoidia bacterium]